MKKLSIFILLLAATFTSCSSDDSVSYSEEQLVGKWYLTSSTLNDETDVADDCFSQTYFEFKADRTLEEQWYASRPNSCEEYIFIERNWSLSGVTLTYEAQDLLESYEHTILELTTSTLKLERKGEDVINGLYIPFTITRTFSR